MKDDGEDAFSPDIVSYFPHKFPDLWDRTKEIFNKDIKTISDINTTFYEGNSGFFKELEKSYPEEGNEFLKVFGNIRNLVLDSEKILKDEIKILTTKATDKLILNRKEVALIFTLGFFEIFMFDAVRMKVNLRYSFHDILKSGRGSDLSKARCFLNYLTVIGRWLEENNPLLEENVTFIRENKEFDINNFDSKQKLCDIKIVEKGSLFDSEASFQVDFANQYIGGGVLSGGCVQEEILFTVNPEAIVSIFFMQRMDDNDAIRIDNLIQYSNYSGYARSFKFENDATKDITKIKKHNIIAIDAVCTYSSGGVDKDSVERDLIKAYVGFNLINFDDEKVITMTKTIATGNWGCGAFGGDFELKFLQQWIAASYAGVKKLYYYTFDKKEMADVIKNCEKIKLFRVKDLYMKLTKANLIKGQVLETTLDKSISEIEDIMDLEEVKNNDKKKESCCETYCKIY